MHSKNRNLADILRNSPPINNNYLIYIEPCSETFVYILSCHETGALERHLVSNIKFLHQTRCSKQYPNFAVYNCKVTRIAHYLCCSQTIRVFYSNLKMQKLNSLFGVHHQAGLQLAPALQWQTQTTIATSLNFINSLTHMCSKISLYDKSINFCTNSLYDILPTFIYFCPMLMAAILNGRRFGKILICWSIFVKFAQLT